MNLDLDIIRPLLQSFNGDQPTLLADFAPERVNAHREQMLREGFATGHLTAPDRQPLVWDYSHAFLIDSGGRPLALSSHTAAWERAKEAYDMREQP
jgi:hypothetical protein